MAAASRQDTREGAESSTSWSEGSRTVYHPGQSLSRDLKAYSAVTHFLQQGHIYCKKAKPPCGPTIQRHESVQAMPIQTSTPRKDLVNVKLTWYSHYSVLKPPYISVIHYNLCRQDNIKVVLLNLIFKRLRAWLDKFCLPPLPLKPWLSLLFRQVNK